MNPVTKEKLKSIQGYKKYFFNYFKLPVNDIYSKVTFLDREAVTYLVIASEFDKVSPLKHRFPFFGEFPYLGFFSKKSAEDFGADLVSKQYYIYIRPVYAYSSLGHFEDRILSSFFHYGEFELAELIFHELFHTIFFIEDEVNLNENLANFFGKEMAFEYFQYKKDKKERVFERINRIRALNARVAELAKNYDKAIREMRPKNKSEADRHLSQFMQESFIPVITRECKKIGIELSKCYPLKKDWNNARFAAFLTYENNANYFRILRERLDLNLINYFYYLENTYKEFKRQSEEDQFIQFLKRENP